MKIYWLSRHDLSPAQQRAIRDLHGENVEIVKDPRTLEDLEGLANYIREHDDGFVYAVVPAHMAIHAALEGYSFGLFANHPQKRADGSFGLAAVYWVGEGRITQVWVNPDPMSDEGEPLVPVR